jgi:DNA-binding MarR family transcriptional regulator
MSEVPRGTAAAGFPGLPYDLTMATPKQKTKEAPTAEGAAVAQNLAAARVLRQFRQVFNAVKTHFQQVERKTGVGGAQLWALSIIRSNPGIGVNALAQAMDVHQSTASNLIKTLVEREFIVTSKSEFDRRSVELIILPAGTRLLRKAPGPFTGVLPEALAQLDAEALARLEDDLAQLLALLNADERAANIPLGQVL